MLSMDKTLVDENNLEILPNSIIHCLGSLFQVSDAGLRHIVGKFTFTEKFAVIDGMVSDMLLGIKWEHRFNIHTGWT